jgi:KaiC/GvpD/RAD55 family RecA-like ATPase
MEHVENWTINWCHFDDIVNIDMMTTASQKDVGTQRATDLDLNTAHNILHFRLNEQTFKREFRIVKMEASSHPLQWIPFRITNKGIELQTK